MSDAQRREDRLIAERHRDSDRVIAERDRDSDHTIARSREQQNALQDYLAAITDLIRAGELNTDALRSIARARTVTVLPNLDANGKRRVLTFIHEAGLIAAPSPAINLRDADLRDADLRNARLGGAFLADVDLSGADLKGAFFRGANLSRARMNDAAGAEADFGEAILTGCDLRGTDFTRAYLVGAKIGAPLLDDRTRFDRALIINADFTEGYPTKPVMNAYAAKRNAEEAKQRWIDALSAASWSGTGFDYSTKWPADFRPEHARDISD